MSFLTSPQPLLEDEPAMDVHYDPIFVDCLKEEVVLEDPGHEEEEEVVEEDEDENQESNTSSEVSAEDEVDGEEESALSNVSLQPSHSPSPPLSTPSTVKQSKPRDLERIQRKLARAKIRKERAEIRETRDLIKSLMQRKPMHEQLATFEYLISIVRRFPSIYDPNHKEFRNLAYNKVIWVEIGQEAGISQPEKVFSNLKSTYKRMKQRLAETGQEPDTSRRVFFELMQICDDPNHVMKEPYVPPPNITKKSTLVCPPSETSGVRLTKKERKKREVLFRQKLCAAKKEETQKLNAMVFRMLKEVENHPCLFDPQITDRQTAKKAWEKVVAKTGVLDARKRFSNLRSTYRRVKFRKFRERASKFVFYEAMKFLDPFITCGYEPKYPMEEEGDGECDSRLNNTHWSDSDDSFLWKHPGAINASTTDGVGGKQAKKDSEEDEYSRYSEGDSQSMVMEEEREGADDGPTLPLIDEWPSIVEMREKLKTEDEKRMFSMWLKESAQECMEYIESLR